jgi:hypothetical protein
MTATGRLDQLIKKIVYNICNMLVYLGLAAVFWPAWLGQLGLASLAGLGRLGQLVYASLARPA